MTVVRIIRQETMLNWFKAITNATIVKLAARVDELEKQVEHEFEFGCRLAKQYSSTCEELRQTRESYLTALESIKTYAAKLNTAETAYKSLLADYYAHVDKGNEKLNQEIGELKKTQELLTKDNNRLRDKLTEALELSDDYAELNEVYINSLKATLDELADAKSRAEVYRECLINNRELPPVED